MKRKLILSMAMSLDGFIADKDGGYDWLHAHSAHSEVNEFSAFDSIACLQKVDTIMMGINSYNQGLHKWFVGKKVFVATNKVMESIDNVHFIEGDIRKIISDELKEDGENILLLGGGVIAEPFIDVNVIDEYIIGMVPIILGEGSSFFMGGTSKILVDLKDSYIEKGVVILRYTKSTKKAKIKITDIG